MSTQHQQQADDSLQRGGEPDSKEIDLPAGQPPSGNVGRRPTSAAEAQHAALVADACRLIEAADSLPDLGTLAQHAGLSPSHFHRVFKAQTGLTPKAYASAHRANRLRHALGEARSVTDAIYDAGFNTNSRFYEKADRLLGMRARDYRAGGDGVTIRFAVAQCSLGAILVAQSERGICAILMDDDPAVLVKDLQDRFPKAHLIGGDADFEQLVARVIGFVEAPAIGLDLPLDLQGTAFQERVWQALRKIPVGTTLSYAAIAARHRRPSGRARRGPCMRRQPAGRGGALPPRGAPGWRPVRLSLGRRAQARAAAPGKGTG